MASGITVRAGGTWEGVLNDGNTKGWYMVGDGSSTYITLSGTNVTNWKDQSGNNNDLINATSAEQPDYDSGNAEIDFNADAGTDDNLQKTSVTTNQPFTFYAVIRINTNGTRNILYFNVSSSVYTTNTVPNRLTLNSGIALTINNAATGSYGIVTGIVNGANSLLQWNNETATTGDAGSIAGGVIRVGTGANSSEFSIKEYIFRSGADNETDRTIVKNYLNSKYTIY